MVENRRALGRLGLRAMTFAALVLAASTSRQATSQTPADLSGPCRRAVDSLEPRALLYGVPAVEATKKWNLLEVVALTAETRTTLSSVEFRSPRRDGPAYVSLTLSNPGLAGQLNKVARMKADAEFEIVVNGKGSFRGSHAELMETLSGPANASQVGVTQRAASAKDTDSTKSVRTLSTCQEDCYSVFESDMAACDENDTECTRDAHRELQNCLCVCEGGSCCPMPPTTGEEFRGDPITEFYYWDGLCFARYVCPWPYGDYRQRPVFRVSRHTWSVTRDYCTGAIISETYVGLTMVEVVYGDWVFLTCC